jgi:transposase-like protein
MTNETLRKWVRRAEIDGGARPGVSSAEGERVKELEREVKELRRANEILKAASVFFARELAATETMSSFIDEHRPVFGVEPICRALQVAPSTYYAVRERQRRPAARTLRDSELLGEIRRVYEASSGLSGPGRCGGSCSATGPRSRAARWSG